MNRRLALLCAAYLLLAVGFNLATPYGQAPDEWAHVDYIRRLSAGQLPRLDPAQRQTGYEAHQPPLYYALCVPIWQLATALGASEAAAARAVRGVSTLLGLLGILAVEALGRAVLGAERSWPALLAAGFVALLPMRLALSAAVTNDPLAELLATLALCQMVLLLREGVTPGRAARLGLLLGASLLTKMSLVMLFPPALLALARLPRGARQAAATARPARFGGRQGSPAAATRAGTGEVGPVLRGFALCFGIALLLGGPWLLRNQLLYGDPLANRAFESYFADTPRWDGQAGGLVLRRNGPPVVLPMPFAEYLARLVLPVTFASFWGAFGHLDRPDLFLGALDRNYPPASWVYPILSLVMGTALISAGGRAGRALCQRRTAGAEVTLVLGLFTVLVVASFLRFNTVFFQAQGRYLFLALGPVALLLASGWLALAPEKAQPAVATGLLLGMLALALYALFGVVLPGFSRA